MLIVLEGIDAAGKGTQAAILARKLGAVQLGFPAYGTPVGHMIRGHLRRYWRAAPGCPDCPGGLPLGGLEALDAAMFQALQAANKLEVAPEIERLMLTGRDVVLDRYWQSSWVYGQAEGLQGEWLDRMNTYLPHPDLSILVDVPAALSVERRPERRDRYEDQADVIERAVHLYRQLWRERGEREGAVRWAVVDGAGAIEEVAARVFGVVERFVRQGGVH